MRLPRRYHATLSHVLAGTHRRCPVCRQVLDDDHDEALAIAREQVELIEIDQPLGIGGGTPASGV